MKKDINTIRKIWYLNKKMTILRKLLSIDEQYYERWIIKNENYNLSYIRKDIFEFKYHPLISILIPVYKVNTEYLRQCLQSIESQYYEKWEVCIVDDNSKDENIKKVLDEFRLKWPNKVKIQMRDTNGHISQATNDALRLATGEYILLLDNDDVISSFCLYEVVKVLNKNRKIDLIYSNEDKIENEIRFCPYFKPKWNRQILKIDNYISHVGVYRRDIAIKIGGFRTGLEGAQDWDFVLRFTQLTHNIEHIPKFLYHWRYLDTSTSKSLENKPYVKLARQKIIEKIGEGYYD